jgi:nitrate/TMAO reductase-like tetraheme cytochrome c subunit
MGYHGVGVATQDMALGLSFLKDIAAQSSFPWLSANLYSKSAAGPVFSPTTIVEIGSLRIGLIGLTGKAGNLIKESDDVLIKPWQEVLPPIVADLTAKTDMLVLLSNLTPTENKEIAKHYDIHVIVQSGISAGNLAPTLIDNTLICQTAKQGKQLGIMNISWQTSKTWGEKTAEKLAKAKQSLDRIDWQLSKYNKYPDPIEDLKELPGKLQAYQNTLLLHDNLRQEIDTLTNQLSKPEETAIVPATFKNSFIAMQTSLPNDPTVQKIVEGINREINEAGQKKSTDENILTSTHTGWEACKNCHAEIFNAWSQTPHAKAYATLLNKRQQFNVDCLPCHVTGITDENADLSLTLPAGMRNVGCEACHGPGKRHVGAPAQFKPVKNPATAICLQCHTTDHDDSFDYQKDKQRVHTKTIIDGDRS